jgi:hypothetical protein
MPSEPYLESESNHDGIGVLGHIFCLGALGPRERLTMKYRELKSLKPGMKEEASLLNI